MWTYRRIVTLFRQLAVAVSVASVAGCLAGCLGGGQSLGGQYHPGGLGGAGAGASSGGGGTNGSSGAGADAGENAGPFCGTLYSGVVAPVRADILIVLDRSSSMNDDSNEMSCAGGCGSNSKWALLSAAISRMVTNHPSVNWGLAPFGSDDACGVNPGVTVDVAQDAAPSVELALAATTPGGATPTAAAILGATAYLQSRTDANPKYILLATDGRSGCATGGGGAAAADTEAGNAVASAFHAGIPTFVVGMVPAWDTTATASLNQMADNGGQPSLGTPNTFFTTDGINTQLSLISGASPPGNPCVLNLLVPLAPGTSLAVSVATADGQSVVVPEDPLAGWSFTSPDHSAVDISGSACTGLKSGAYSQIAITYLCDRQTLPPPGRSRPSVR
jgi:hypothetical protein